MFQRVRSMVSKRRVSVSQIVDIGLRNKNGELKISAHTFKNYQSINKKLVDFFGDVSVSSLSIDDLTRFHDSLDNGNRQPSTVNSYRRNLQAVWNRLHNEGITDFRGSDFTAFLPENPQQPYAIRESTVRMLIERCNLRDQAMIMLALRTGIRRQSLPKLTVDSCHIWQNEEGRFRFAALLPQEKTSSPRYIFAKHDAAILVRAWLDVRRHDSLHLFNKMSSPEPMTVHNVSSIWASACKRALLKKELHGAAWHRLRHTFAQDKLDERHDARLVAEWMGIDVSTLLAVYATPDPNRQAEQFFGEEIPRDVIKGVHNR